MARSSTTRKGNGAGWGGAAKGFVPNPNEAKPVEGPGPGRGHMSVKGMKKAERVELYREMLFGIASNDGEMGSTRVSAITHLWDREEGKPVATTTLQGGDSPLQIQRIERVIIDPANPDSPRLPAAPDA